MRGLGGSRTTVLWCCPTTRSRYGWQNETRDHDLLLLLSLLFLSLLLCCCSCFLLTHMKERQEGCPGVCPDSQQGGTNDLFDVSGSEVGALCKANDCAVHALLLLVKC